MRLMTTPQTTTWHTTPLTALYKTLKTSAKGLTEAEAAARLSRDGPNTLTTRSGPSWLRKLAAQFIEPLVLVLLLAVGLSIFLGDYVDAAVIGGVVLLNALIGFVQEHRAGRSIAALSEAIVTEATTLRDGKLIRIPSAALVVGDVVMVQSGDAIPADVRLIDARSLKVEESSLTGESLPVDKRVGELASETVLNDRYNMAFAGCAVTYGQAHGLVVATGDATQAGHIARLMAETTSLQTPLTRRIAQLSSLIVRVVMVLAVAMLGVGWWRGASLSDSFNAAIALAVGAIPEGLPAAVTILLAVGVSSMAKRGALIRSLPAVEALGSTTVICSDKTGTLTQNRMAVTDAFSGGQPLTLEPMPETLPATTRELLLAGALCNDARHIDATHFDGDPTEVALLDIAARAGLTEAIQAAYPRLDVVPFESEHMYMATLHRGEQASVIYVKGSSDALFARCITQLNATGDAAPFDRDAAELNLRRMASAGLRVLVVARKACPVAATQITHADVGQLELIGLVGMIDPPRPEAAQAVETCKAAGIKVKMITGDHAVTATAIAQALGLEGARGDDDQLIALTGAELAQLDEDELGVKADAVAVFARVAPEQKLRLVRALQANGHIVAMTGDGVNDAPALKQADIGVAMGQNGTDVARSASAMILTDDNFATIAAAVEEGRGIYDNLEKFIAWSLPTNGGEGLVLLVAMLLGTTLPVLPIQLLWVNMATAMLGATLIFEPREPGLMMRSPRRVDAPIMDRRMIAHTIIVSAVVGGAAFGCFAWAMRLGSSDEVARTVAINTIVVVEVGYLFACRSLRLPIWRIGVLSNRGIWIGAALMLLVQLGMTYLPIMNRLFHTRPIAWWWWVVMTGIGLLIFMLAEARKALMSPRAS